MFIEEKYLITEKSNGAGEGSPATTLKCRFCGREFMVPNTELGKLTVQNVCESESCKTLFEKEKMSNELEKAKNNSPEADVVKKAVGN